MMMKRISLSLYRRRLASSLIIGVMLGIMISILLSAAYSNIRDPMIAEKGITVLLSSDGSIMVPKGALIEGKAVEIIDFDGRIVKNYLKTPYTTTEKIMIRCPDEDSVCVISLPNTNGTEYYRQQLVDKILK